MPRNYRIVNLVATSRFENPVNPEELRHMIPDARPERRRPSTLWYRPPGENATLLVAKSGKIILICSDPPARVDAKLNAVIALIRARVTSLPNLASAARVQNIVATFDIGMPTDIGRLARKVALDGTVGEYEPEVFPGMILHPWNDRVTVLLYGTGKGVISGARSDDEISRAISWTKSLVG